MAKFTVDDVVEFSEIVKERRAGPPNRSFRSLRGFGRSCRV